MSLREKLRDLEEGDTVRVVSEERDVLARVGEDEIEREDVDVTERIVEAQARSTATRGVTT